MRSSGMAQVRTKSNHTLKLNYSFQTFKFLEWPMFATNVGIF